MFKRILLAALFIAGAYFSSFAQSIDYKNVSNKDLTYVLNNLQKRYEYTDHKTLNIAVYIVNDPPNSGGNADCAITNSIYIAVSDLKPDPEQHVFKINSVCSPKFINWIKSKKMYKIAFSYGVGAKKKTATVGIMLKKLVVE